MIDKTNLIRFTSTSTIKKQEKEQKNGTQEAEQKETKTIPTSTYHAYNSISFKGKNNIDLYTSASEMLAQTSPEETVSTQEAVEILKPLNLSEKKLLDYLLACSYDSHDENVIINKKALIYAILLNNGYNVVPAAKIPFVIASSLDNENKCFSEKTFEGLFNVAGKIRATKIHSLKSPREINSAGARKLALIHKAKLSQEISECLKNTPQTFEHDFDIDSIFSIELEKEKQTFLNMLEETKDNLPEALYKKLAEGIKNNNFDLKGIYTDYYSLLNDCKTLNEVKELYPEIKIPDLNFENTGFERHLRSRLANEDVDKIGLDILKKLYIEQKSESSIMVNLENSYPTTYMSMVSSGIDFGKVPDGIRSMIDKSKILVGKFQMMDKMDDKSLEFAIRRNASKQSRIWAEYIGITNKYWHPVRAIYHKQKHPLTSYYQTDKLVDGYLFYLYKYQNKSIPSANPIEKYADGSSFTQEKKSALEKLYFLFRNNHNKEINSEEFLQFKKNFDIEEMKKSVTKLECHYKNTFAKWFMTPERRQKYEQAMENSYRLVFEKMDLCKQSSMTKNIDVSPVVDSKLSEEELVDYIEATEEADDENLINEFVKYKKIINASGNQELRDLFRMYIGNNENEVDWDNFRNFQPLLEEGIVENTIPDPDKFILLFKINNMYMNHVFEEENPVSKEEFTDRILKNYTKEDGNIDYTALNRDINVQNEYSDLLLVSLDPERKDFADILDKKFVQKQDYNTAYTILKMYDNLPDTFKSDFYSLAASTDKTNNDIFAEQLQSFYDRIDSWHLDEDEIITMDADKIPQNVVITSKVKYELLKDCNNNIDRFGTLINKFYNAATKRIGDRQGQGVKVLSDNVKYAAELKIQGSQAVGSKRLYARIPTQEDIEKYGNIKYVFDTFDEHL